MSSIEAPTIETFTPVDDYRVMGLGYVTLRNPDGVRLDLSEAGAQAVDQDPTLAALFDRMGDFIAEHDGYRDGKAVKEVEPGAMPKVASDPKLRYHKAARLATTYHPDRVPGVLIKAHDFQRCAAVPQFYFGDWLQAGLEHSSDGVKAVRQFGLFTAPGRQGHRTVVMEYAPGETMRSLAAFKLRGALKLMSPSDSGNRAMEEAEDLVEQLVRESIRNTLGQRGRIVANDIQTPDIVVADPDAVTPDNILEHKFTIIDQPVIKKQNIALLGLVRRVPSLRLPSRPDLSPSPHQLPHSAQ